MQAERIALLVNERQRSLGRARAAPDPDAWEAGRDPGDPERTGGPPEPRWRFLKPLSAADICRDATLDDTNWIWRHFIPEESLVMLASFMKEGKSTLTYALLGAIVTGREFLGRPTCRVPVLVLAVEEHLRDVKAHLRESGIGPDAPVMFHVGLYPDTPEALGELRSFIVAKAIKLLVIDTLSRFWRITSENDAAEVIAKLGPLLDLARDLRITILLLHHTGKGQPGAEFNHGREIRGSSAIFALVDQALILTRAKGGAPTMRVLRAVGRFRETPEELLIDYDEEGGYSVVESGETAQDRDDAREQKILGFVVMNPGCTRTGAQQGAKVGRQRGLRLIEVMIREGQLVERAGGLHMGSGELTELSGTAGTGSGVPAPPKGGSWNSPRNRGGNLAELCGTVGPDDARRRA